MFYQVLIIIKNDDDDKYLEKQVNILKSLIKRINSYIDENGSIKLPFNFVDWPTHCDNPQNELDYMKSDLTQFLSYNHSNMNTTPLNICFTSITIKLGSCLLFSSLVW